MECSRCGGEAVVKRDNAVYCGKCALARDWEEIIHVVQMDRLALGKPDTGSPSSKPADVSPTAADAAAEANPPTAQAPADPFA